MRHLSALVFAMLAVHALAADDNQAERRNTERDHVQALLLAQPGAEEECDQKAGNQAELKDCLAALLPQAKQDRQNAEAATLAAMKQLDRIQLRSEAVPALQQDIKAYSRYQKAHCRWVAASYGSGTGSGIAEAACRIDLDRARAHAFSIYYMR